MPKRGRKRLGASVAADLSGFGGGAGGRAREGAGAAEAREAKS